MWWKDFKLFQTIRPTSKQNSRVISIKDNKPFYHFALGGNIKFLASASVAVIFPLMNPKLLPAGSPDQTSCPDTGVPTRVSNPTSVKCARRSSPAATTCPNTSKCTASRGSAGRFAPQTEAPTRRSSGNLSEPPNSWMSGAGAWATGAGRECTGLDAWGQLAGGRRWKHALSCCNGSLIYCQRAKRRDGFQPDGSCRSLRTLSQLRVAVSSSPPLCFAPFIVTCVSTRLDKPVYFV